MSTKWKKAALLWLLLCLAPFLCGCTQNPSQERLYEKLLAAFENAGYACTLEELPEDAPVGLYKASAWKALRTNGETVLVYFDESNRADYLVTMIQGDACGYATHFGQRFVLTYAGEEEALLSFLRSDSFE